MKLSEINTSELTVSEKLELVENLWDEIAADADSVPIHQWQIEELDRRKAECEKNPDPGSSWDDVKARIRRAHGR